METLRCVSTRVVINGFSTWMLICVFAYIVHACILFASPSNDYPAISLSIVLRNLDSTVSALLLRGPSVWLLPTLFFIPSLRQGRPFSRSKEYVYPEKRAYRHKKEPQQAGLLFKWCRQLSPLQEARCHDVFL